MATPLDPMDLTNLALFSNLQGNILKGHGRDNTTHIFIHFDGRREKAAREWLKEFTGSHVTSFQKQLKERELFQRNKVSGGLFANVFLTKAGYEYLGFADVDQKLPDAGFTSGMQNRLNETADPVVSKWEKGFRGDIHAMILLADDDLSRMGTVAKTILNELDNFSSIETVEYGNAIRNKDGNGLEHFGYVDGVSQPLFLKDEVDGYMKFHDIPTKPILFDPTADKELVLIPDPYTNEPEAFGSYFVFRKLEQNVRAFKEAEEKLGLDELGGAYLVGRFEDGTPTLLSKHDSMIDSDKINNFNYDTDPSGGRCPHFAHVRKTNPRRPGDKSHIMARRGIPFGHRNVDTALEPSPLQSPEEGVGLLFMSYQASIPNQFEFIQKFWANNEHFPQANSGIDPIIGQGTGSRNYAFPNQYGNPNEGTTPMDFKEFVTMKGGEYFFTPSIPFLRNL